MENLDHDPIILTGRTRDQLPIFIKRQPSARFQDYSRMFQHVYAGAFFVMYASLLGFIQVKSQKQNYSPFETHVFFIVISLVALPIAIVTSGVLFYANGHLESIRSIRRKVFPVQATRRRVSLRLKVFPVQIFPGHLESRNTKNIPPIQYLFLKVVFLFSTILAPLSLVLVLFIPSELNWIGYSIICALFTIMVAYTLGCYMKLFEKKDVSNFAAHQIV